MVAWSEAPDRELRSKVVGSIASHVSNISILDCKLIDKVPSIWLIVICSDSSKDDYLE